MKYRIWHNTRGSADEYFITKGNDVLLKIPKWLGKLLEGGKKMNNLGFISKRKVAREIAKIYNTKGHSVPDSEACSTLNSLCDRLKIKPMHRNKLGGGTGEMMKGE